MGNVPLPWGYDKNLKESFAWLTWVKMNTFNFSAYKCWKQLSRNFWFFEKFLQNSQENTLHKKWSFPLGISSVNVTTVSCGFGHIYWRNPWRKTSFFVQWHQCQSLFFNKVAYRAPLVATSEMYFRVIWTP